jgi:hypothetical protein
MKSVTPSSGSVPSTVPETLRQFSTDAANLSSFRGSGRELLEAYMRWAEAAGGSLAYALEPEDVTRLVFTPDYWVLRQMAGDEARIHGQIYSELQRRAGDLFTIAGELQDELEHWATEGTVAVVDTNMLVQTTHLFDEIPWESELNAMLVHLVIPMAVIRQLDNLKRTGRDEVRTQAREALKKIRMLVSTPGLRADRGPENQFSKQPTIEVLAEPLGTPRLPTEDENIIATVSRIHRLVPKGSILLVTWDSNMAFMAAGEGVLVREISREWERKDPPSRKVKSQVRGDVEERRP